VLLSGFFAQPWFCVRRRFAQQQAAERVRAQDLSGAAEHCHQPGFARDSGPPWLCRRLSAIGKSANLYNLRDHIDHKALANITNIATETEDKHDLSFLPSFTKLSSLQLRLRNVRTDLTKLTLLASLTQLHTLNIQVLAVRPQLVQRELLFSSISCLQLLSTLTIGFDEKSITTRSGLMIDC